MQNHFGVVVFADDVIIGMIAEQFVLEVAEVRELAVEREGKPLPFLRMFPLEWLCVFAAVLPAGRIAHVADDGAPAELFQNARVLFGPTDAKRFVNGTEFLVRIDQFAASRVVPAEPGRQLPAILQIEQHSRHQPGYEVRIATVNRGSVVG